jgi:hypothetical protein
VTCCVWCGTPRSEWNDRPCPRCKKTVAEAAAAVEESSARIRANHAGWESKRRDMGLRDSGPGLRQRAAEADRDNDSGWDIPAEITPTEPAPVREPGPEDPEFAWPDDPVFVARKPGTTPGPFGSELIDLLTNDGQWLQRTTVACAANGWDSLPEGAVQ